MTLTLIRIRPGATPSSANSTRPKVRVGEEPLGSDTPDIEGGGKQ